MRKFCCKNCRSCVGFYGFGGRMCKHTGDIMTDEKAKEYCCKDFRFNPAFEDRFIIFDEAPVIMEKR